MGLWVKRRISKTVGRDLEDNLVTSDKFFKIKLAGILNLGKDFYDGINMEFGMIIASGSEVNHNVTLNGTVVSDASMNNLSVQDSWICIGAAVQKLLWNWDGSNNNNRCNLLVYWI